MHAGWKFVVLAAAITGAVLAGPAPSAAERAVLERISAQSMRGHVSFLASDLLQGRATPSPGLDIAAEYIASQFRRSGLEPASGGDYFQNASFFTFEPDTKDAVIELESGGKRIRADLDKTSVQTSRALSMVDAPVLKLAGDAETIDKLKPEDVKGKVVALVLNRGYAGAFRAYGAIRRLQPALLLVSGSAAPRGGRAPLVAADQRDRQVPIVGVREGQIADAIEHAQPGSADLKITIQVSAPEETALTLRNVAAVLRGSDPQLRDTYVLVTAHYDHMGVKPTGDGDRIFNGANDDASGTASLIEIANALASMDPKPKRSIVFIALFGEELGLLGSQYYGRHPLFPLAQTVADINLEHLGRTDSNDGAKIASASFTGFDYSTVPAIFEKAGEETGVTVYKDKKRSDPFFARSDNQALADIGIPAHTLCVAFEFPDYHGVGDEWQKLDYDNMAKIDRMVALGLMSIAGGASTPEWNEKEPKAKRYADAWRALHPAGAAQ